MLALPSWAGEAKDILTKCPEIDYFKTAFDFWVSSV